VPGQDGYIYDPNHHAADYAGLVPRDALERAHFEGKARAQAASTHLGVAPDLSRHGVEMVKGAFEGFEGPVTASQLTALTYPPAAHCPPEDPDACIGNISVSDETRDLQSRNAPTLAEACHPCPKSSERTAARGPGVEAPPEDCVEEVVCENLRLKSMPPMDLGEMNEMARTRPDVVRTQLDDTATRAGGAKFAQLKKVAEKGDRNDKVDEGSGATRQTITPTQMGKAAAACASGDDPSMTGEDCAQLASVILRGETKGSKIKAKMGVKWDSRDGVRWASAYS
jgi:hypothetical protein